MWANLLMYLLVILGGSNLVLCVEADGCAVMETAQDNCCNPAMETVLPSILPLSHDRCDDCIDIPVPDCKLAPHHTLNRSIFQPLEWAVFPSVPCLKPAYPPDVADSIAPQSPLAADSAITCLNTVILLI